MLSLPIIHAATLNCHCCSPCPCHQAMNAQKNANPLPWLEKYLLLTCKVKMAILYFQNGIIQTWLLTFSLSPIVHNHLSHLHLISSPSYRCTLQLQSPLYTADLHLHFSYLGYPTMVSPSLIWMSSAISSARHNIVSFLFNSQCDQYRQ